MDSEENDVIMMDNSIISTDLDVGLSVNMQEGAQELHCEVVKKKDPKSQWCSAINCSNGRYNSPELSFFRFPRDEERCKRWVVNSRREDLLKKTPKELFQGNVLCALHFEDSQFTNAKKNRLKPLRAVPTLFNIPNPPATLLPKRRPPKGRELPKAPIASTSQSEIHQPPLSPPQTSTAVELDPETIISLKKKIDSQRKKIKRLKPKPKPSDTKSAKLEVQTIKSMSSKYLPPECHDFFCKQLDLALKKGKRWSAMDKSHALSLYHASPKAYRLLQKRFFLPSIKTLRRAMQNVEIYPGFPSSIIDAFRLKVSHMLAHDRQCVLVFDEIALKAFLHYNVEKDYVEGFEDFGLFGGKTEKEANHATVFLARSLFSKWKQPFGYFLSNSTMKPEILKELLLAAITTLQGIGLTVKAVLCDQGTNNCAVFRSLNVSADKPYFVHHQDVVLVLFDPPHLLKNIRNNLLRHDFFTSDGVVSWKVIKDFYEKDKTFSLRMAPKLTQKHIELPTFAHLRVNLAAQVLSHSVASGIAFLCQVDIFPASNMATSYFIQRFDNLFNVFNSTGGKSAAPYKHAITPTSSHIQFLKETVDWLRNLQYGSESNKRPAENLPCIRGWIQTVRALLMLVDNTVTGDVIFLLTNRINQDCIENLFAVIRSKGGHRDNPDPQEFRIAFRQIMVDKILLTNPGANCKDDIDSFLLNFAASKPNASDESKSLLNRTNANQEPPQVTNLVKSTKLEDSSQFENVVAYISGYILRKLINASVICDDCRALLEDSCHPHARHLTLINVKTYDSCMKEGLLRPSSVLVKAVAFFEATFQTHVQKCLRKEKLRQNFKAKLLDLPCCKNMKSLTCECCTADYAATLFLTIRIHHELKLRNTTVKQKTRRKVKKLEKLQHN